MKASVQNTINIIIVVVVVVVVIKHSLEQTNLESVRLFPLNIGNNDLK